MTHCYFSESSTDIKLLEDGKKFKAMCRTTPGDYYESLFDLYHYVINLDGQVGFAPVDRLPAAYTDSCNGITLEGTILKGSARRSDGSWSSFSVDLDKNIRNTEGRLTWVVDPSKVFEDPDNDVGGFGNYPVEDNHSVRVPREATITPPSAKDKKDIQNLIRLWDFDMLDPGLGQASEFVTFPRRPRPNEYMPYRDGWRIDLQENGAFTRVVNGVSYQYYSVAVQNDSPVYANALVPVNYNVGRTRIRNALNRSMEEGRVITIDPPNPNVHGRPLPPQTSPQARELYVRSILWTSFVIGASLLLL